MKKVIMEKQFVTVEIAQTLKELGFDEECLCTYNKNDSTLSRNPIHSMVEEEIIIEPYTWRNSKIHNSVITAPLWQQVEEWFETEHNIIVSILVDGQSQFNKRQFYVAVQTFIPHCSVYISVLRDEKNNILLFNTKHEARIAAFEKAIEIIKEKRIKNVNVSNKTNMKTEIIVIKPYPFCPVKVGEKLEFLDKTYYLSKINGTKHWFTLEQIKEDKVLMQFLEIKESKSIEDYIEYTYEMLIEKTNLTKAYYLDNFIKYKEYDLSLITQRFFNSELLRTIAEDLNEGINKGDYGCVIIYNYQTSKYDFIEVLLDGYYFLNTIIFNNEGLVKQAIELMGEERLDTLR